MFESTTFPDVLLESVIVLIFGTIWGVCDWLPNIAVLAAVRWLLARLLGFERRPQVHALISGFVFPALVLFLTILCNLLTDMAGTEMPGFAGLFLAVYFDFRSIQKRMIHPARTQRRMYAFFAILAALAVIFFGIEPRISP